MVFATLLLGYRHETESVEEKSASCILWKGTRRDPSPLRGRQMLDRTVHPRWWPSLTKDQSTEHELIRVNKCTAMHGKNVVGRFKTTTRDRMLYVRYLFK